MMMLMIFVGTNRSTRDIRVEGATMNMSGHSMGMIGFGMDVNEGETYNPEYQPCP